MFGDSSEPYKEMEVLFACQSGWEGVFIWAAATRKQSKKDMQDKHVKSYEHTEMLSCSVQLRRGAVAAQAPLCPSTIPYSSASAIRRGSKRIQHTCKWIARSTLNVLVFLARFTTKRSNLSPPCPPWLATFARDRSETRKQRVKAIDTLRSNTIIAAVNLCNNLPFHRCRHLKQKRKIVRQQVERLEVNGIS